MKQLRVRGARIIAIGLARPNLRVLHLPRGLERVESRLFTWQSPAADCSKRGRQQSSISFSEVKCAAYANREHCLYEHSAAGQDHAHRPQTGGRLFRFRRVTSLGERLNR